MAQTKQYLGFNGLKEFLTKLKSTFSELGHRHTIGDIDGLTIDSELSDTSTNPIQNKVINGEFAAVGEAMLVLGGELDVLGGELDEKAAKKHTHSIEEIGTLQAALDALQTNVPVEPITSDELAKIFNGTYQNV